MRQVYIVNATQVVTSDSHPEGLYSVMSGYPKFYDSRTYNVTDSNPDGDEEKALRMAKSEYLSRLSANYAADNRAMTTVTLELANGRQLMHESIGAFPVVQPVQPEPEPEPETPEEPETPDEPGDEGEEPIEE